MTRSHTRRKRELARLRAARAVERAEARRKRKRIVVSSVASALVVVVGGTVAAVMLTSGGSGTKAATAAQATPAVPAKGTTTKVGSCVYTSDGQKPSKPVSMPAAAPTVAKTPVTAVIKTNYGSMTATLDGAKAPCTTHALETLAGAKYFDNTPCHRETTANLFVLQCGDPTGKGTGGPGFTYANENASTPAFERGVVAMANSGKDTNGSQFFVNYKSADAATAKQLADQYSVVGKITKGMDVLDKITSKGVSGGGQDGTPATKPQILSVTVTPAT